MLTFVLLLLGQLTLPAEVKGEVGDFIVIKAETPGKTVKWKQLDPGLSVFPSDLLTDKKVTVVVGRKPGKYRVIAWSAVSGEPTEAAECVVIVGTPPPEPLPPGPGPGPSPPDPLPLPDGKLGLIKASREGFKLVQGATEAEKKAVAGVHRTVASMIGTTPLTNANAILIELSERRRAALEGASDKWAPFNRHVRDQMSKVLNDASSLDDWREALGEIAEGLK